MTTRSASVPLASAVPLSAVQFTWIVLLVSVATIAGAWAFELIGGLAPCPLCLQQRWAYYTAIPLLLLALIWLHGGGRARLARLALGLSALAMLAGAAVAVYHTGIEWQWWAGPGGCTGDLLAGNSGSVLPDLKAARVIRCDEAPWRLFGISLAGYNALISLNIAAGAAFGALKIR